MERKKIRDVNVGERERERERVTKLGEKKEIVWRERERKKRRREEGNI